VRQEGSPLSAKARRFEFPGGTAFFESDNYKPLKKVLILTTEKQLWGNKAYSFDFNFLY